MNEEPNVIFMNVDNNGCLINYSVTVSSDYYIRYVDKKPVDGVLPKNLDRIYDYDLHQWFSIPGRPVCVHFGVELPVCDGFTHIEIQPNN